MRTSEVFILAIRCARKILSDPGGAQIENLEVELRPAVDIDRIVVSDNEAAIALYLGSGFEIVGVRKRYYPGSGADAFTMKRPGRLG